MFLLPFLYEWARTLPVGTTFCDLLKPSLYIMPVSFLFIKWYGIVDHCRYTQVFQVLWSGLPFFHPKPSRYTDEIRDYCMKPLVGSTTPSRSRNFDHSNQLPVSSSSKIIKVSKFDIENGCLQGIQPGIAPNYFMVISFGLSVIGNHGYFLLMLHH